MNRLFNAAAALTGAWFSWSFGDRIGGPLIGVVAALNGGLMASLMAAALVDLIQRCRRSLSRL